MSSPSMQFAPAWLKKPTTAAPAQSAHSYPDDPAAGFPLPGIKHANPPALGLGQSYSQIASPRDAFISAPAEETNGNGNGNGDGSVPRPFRYARETMLALFEEDKVRERPLELMEWATHRSNNSGPTPGEGEGPGVTSIILSDKAGMPMGLVEWTIEEKKLFANPIRRQPAHQDQTTTLSSRRNGHLATADTRSPGGRGFGRGEGGAFGGTVPVNTRYAATPPAPGAGAGAGAGAVGADYITAGNEVRAGGAGGAWTPGSRLRDPPAAGSPGLTGDRRSLRGTLRREVSETADAPRTPGAVGGQGSWRPGIRTTPSTTSFEGVLAFGATTPSKPVESPAARDGIAPSTGGGPGWGKGRWRAAAQEREAADREGTDKRPALAALVKESSADDPQPSESMAVVPPATPVEQRDRDVRGVGHAEQGVPSRPASASAGAFGVDPRAVNWYYTDPSGQQQGPFEATNMQTWFAASYFNDSLPLRREHETTYRTLAALKEETGTATEPFLTRPVPKFPPNLPIPSNTVEATGMEANLSNLMHNASLNASPSQTSGQRTPFTTQSPAFAQASVRAVDPFGNSASYHSSPVVQHGLPVRPGWENPIASPAISRAAFGEVPHMHQQAQAFAGFPQQQYAAGQSRSIFESSPQIQSPFAQPPPVQSPWGVPQASAQMMPAQHYVASPFQQSMQSPYASVPGMQPWHGTPTPQSAVVQQQQTQHMQHAYSSPVPAPREAQQPALEQTSIVDSVLSPVQAASVVQEAPRVDVGHEALQSETEAVKPATEAAIIIQQPEIVAPAVLAEQLEIPAVKETSKTKRQGKKAKAAAVERVEVEAASEPEAQTQVDNEASPSATPSVAPWAKDEEKAKPSTGPSLREIQEAEAKAAENRKQEKAKAAAKAVSGTTETEASQTVSWGLPSRTGGAAVVAPAPTASPAPVWGSSDAAPKKTLKQIQVEEQRRAKAAAQAKASASPAVAAQQGKRGYADLAAAQAAQTGAGGAWSTVGAGGKTAGSTVPAVSKPKLASTPSMVASPAKPPVSVAKPAKAAANLDDIAPSVDFIRWCKESLKGLKVNMDEFIQMLLTFPVEPGASSRTEQLEIISDSVYANSSTLDGRRFAQEFYTKRKADAQNRLANGNQAPAKINSLADIVKTQPKAAGSDFGGFKVVKAKGKGRK